MHVGGAGDEPRLLGFVGRVEGDVGGKLLRNHELGAMARGQEDRGRDQRPGADREELGFALCYLKLRHQRPHVGVGVFSPRPIRRL